MPEQPCAFHPDRLTGVSCSRCERRICPDDMHPAAVGLHCPICAGLMREGPGGYAAYRVRATANRAPLLRQLNGASVTSGLIGLNAVIFALMFLTGRPTSYEILVRFGALVSPLPDAQWWRLVTAMFVHIGLLHLVFNMFALTIFGAMIETRYGKARFLGLYLASGVLGSASSLAFSGASLSAGASGAIFGIFGAWLALVLAQRHDPAMRGQLRGWMLLVGVNVYFGAVNPGVDNFAHLGGLAGGLIVAAALETAMRVKGSGRFAVAAMGFAAVLLASFVIAAPHLV